MKSRNNNHRVLSKMKMHLIVDNEITNAGKAIIK